MKSLKKLFPYLRPYFWTILLSASLAFPLAALRVGPVPLVGYLINEVIAKKDFEKLFWFPFIIIGIFILNFIVRFAHYFLNRIVIARVNQKLKNDLYEHVLGLSADYFSEKSTGNLMSRIATDPNYVDGGISSINILVREPITFIALFGYVFYLNWRLTLITLIMFPALAWVFSATGRFLKRYITKMAEENANLFSTLQETITGIRVVKAFQLESYSREKYHARSDAFARFMIKTAAVEESAHPMVELITALAIAPIIYLGGSLVLKDQMNQGELFQFFVAFGMMMNPIRMMNDVNIKLNQASAATDRIFEIMDWKSTLHQSASPKPISGVQKEICFENVVFAYPDKPERLVLNNVTFTVPRGKAVALVGASGAGKSSTVNLLPRIFDVLKGKITIDGIDLKEFKLEELRRQIAVVSQDIFLFNDTITENIRCGRLGATDQEIRLAAERAHAHDFIRHLPGGYDTVIGDRGQKLSGGERQRLSIARAFLREAPILILDEATSSLDSASEKAVQGALDELMQNRTAIVIAHRLSTIQHIEQIIVLKDGQIIERGRHEELVKSQGEYARFQRLLQQ